MTAPNSVPASQATNWWRKISPSHWADAQRLGLIALAYLFAHRLAMISPEVAGILVAVWPPGGVALAALLLSPQRQRRAILATIFVTGALSAIILSGRRVLPSASFMMIDMLESWGCVWLMTRWCGNRVTFARVVEVLALVACAFVVNGVTAFLGATTAMVVSGAPFYSFLQTWWIANGLGILLVTPLVVVCAQPWRGFAVSHWLRLLEAAALGLVSCACAWFGFLGAAAGWPVMPQPYWIFMPLVWAALRFGIRGTTLLLALLAVISLGLTATGHGSFPLGGDEAIGRLHMVQLFLGTIAVTCLVLAATVTERNQAEAKSRESHALLKTIVDGTPDLVYVKNLQGQYLLFNRGAERIVGKSAAEVLGKDVRTILPPALAEMCMESDRQTIESGTLQTFEETRTSATGETVTLLSIKGPLVDANGKVTGLFGVARDITERKRAEVLLQESEERYRNLFDRAGEGILVLSPDGKIIATNETFARMRGYRVEELRQMRLKDLATPESARPFSERVACLQTGEVLAFEVEHRHKDGHLIPFEVSASLISSGGKSYVQCFYRDITERKQAEAALAGSEAKFRATFEQAAVGMAQVGLDGRWLRINQRLCDILGYPRDELLRKTYQDLTHPDDLAASLALVRRIVEGEIPSYSIEKRYIRRDHSAVPVNLTVSLLRGASVEPESFIAVVEDITERKRSEEALRASERQVKQACTAGNVGLWDWDLRTNKVYFSPEWKRQIGYENSEISGEFSEWQTRVHPEDLGPVLQKVRDHVEGRSSKYELEFRLRHKDGSYRWILSQGSMFADEMGKPRRLLGSHVDITERKREDEKLQKNEHQLRDSQKVARLGSWDLDLITPKLDWSDQTFELFDRSPATFTPSFDEFARLVHPEDHATMQTAFDRALASDDSPYHGAVRIINASGRQWVMEAFGVVRRDRNGRPLSIYGTAQDVTERIQAEVELRANETRLRLAMEAAHQGWFELDLRTGQVVTSPEYMRLIGYDPVIFTSNFANFMEHVHPEDRASTQKTLDQSVASGQTCTAEYRRQTAAGEWLWFQSIGRVVEYDPDGKPCRLCGTHTDITDQVAQRQKLQALLAQTERDAHTKGELLREVNHRVTNNLTAVLGLMAFETEHLARTKVRAVAPVLDRLGQRIRGLLHVHRLLAQSSWAPVRIDQLAEQIIRSTLGTALGGQPAVVTIKPTVLKVSPRQAGTLAMVINELATNTVKHAGQPSDAVSIRFEAESDPKGITLRYRDNGPGYPPDVVADEQANIGLKLIRELVVKTLRGSVVLSTDNGAVVTIHIRQEEETRT